VANQNSPATAKEHYELTSAEHSANACKAATFGYFEKGPMDWPTDEQIEDFKKDVMDAKKVMAFFAPKRTKKKAQADEEEADETHHDEEEADEPHDEYEGCGEEGGEEEDPAEFEQDDEVMTSDEEAADGARQRRPLYIATADQIASVGASCHKSKLK
jgi:hypothetical protein